jgi:hypothetical protein
MNKLHDFECKISDGAAQPFETCYNKLLQLKYKSDSTNIGAYVSKLITYFPRIALIIELMNQSASDIDAYQPTISHDSVLKSYDVIKYFLNTAQNVYVDIGAKEDMATIIKAGNAQKRGDKITVLLQAIEAKELSISQIEVARFTGASKRMVTYYAQKLQKTLKVK